MDKQVRGRFAPSPSGRMHLGNVCCALLAYLAARSAGGEFVLRMEDLDTARCRPPYGAWMLDDLAWLGLTWDEGPDRGGPYGPYTQSQCGGLYDEAIQRLSERGLTYPCFCSRAGLLAAQAPHAGEGEIPYDGRCSRMSQEEIRRLAERKRPSLRLRVEPEPVAFIDGLQGPQRSALPSTCGDFVVRRADGLAAYQLAVVVDDGRMGVTQVVRGRDLLASTARQLYLYRLLGYEPPAFFHIPLLVAPDGRRLSKRERDLDMGALRARFQRPEPLLGRLACLCGLIERPEPMGMEALIGLFRWDRIPQGDIVVNPERF